MHHESPLFRPIEQAGQGRWTLNGLRHATASLCAGRVRQEVIADVLSHTATRMIEGSTTATRSCRPSLVT